MELTKETILQSKREKKKDNQKGLLVLIHTFGSLYIKILGQDLET